MSRLDPSKLCETVRNEYLDANSESMELVTLSCINDTLNADVDRLNTEMNLDPYATHIPNFDPDLPHNTNYWCTGTTTDSLHDGVVLTPCRRKTAHPILNLFQRYSLLETTFGTNHSCIRSRTGIPIFMDNDEYDCLRRHGRAANWKARWTLMNIDRTHDITRAAAVDGSHDPINNTSAFGVYQGAILEHLDADEIDELTDDSESRARIELSNGLWGGSLPGHLNSTQCELHAILMYLLAIQRSAPRPKNERILLVSDSMSAISLIENAWRTRGDHMHSAEHGAIIEMICKTMTDFDRVVYAWVPSHSGIAMNSYADSCAKAHLKADLKDTKVDADWIAQRIDSRPCLYRSKDESTDTWRTVDNPIFKLAKAGARRWVDKTLSNSSNTDITMSTSPSDSWTQVRKAVISTLTVYNKPTTPQEQTADTRDIRQLAIDRTDLVYGIAVGQVRGTDNAGYLDRYARDEIHPIHIHTHTPTPTRTLINPKQTLSTTRAGAGFSRHSHAEHADRAGLNTLW